MKTITQIAFLSTFLFTITVLGQYRDTLVEYQGKKLHFEYKVSWGEEKLIKEIRQFKANQALKSFKSSSEISQLLQEIKISKDPCKNGGFEEGYSGWTGLGLKHSSTTIPIENGLSANPGIAPLPLTGLGSGQNYTSIETTGLDPIISVASPPFNLQRTAPGTTGTRSLRLGNDAPGYSAEGVAKRFVVTAANAKLYFQYAIVMDRSHSNSDGSINGTEVFFIAEATDMSGATIDKIVDVGNPANPFINPVNNGSTYYRNWRCAYLDLSSHIGQEVVLMFINSDCSAGGHNGYTYIDDVCKPCENTNEGDIDLDLDDDNCLKFPQTISGNFVIPTANVSNVNITLDIYQSNSVVNTITSPTISGSNYSFTLNPADFPNQTPGTCYDLVATLTFDITTPSGVVTVTQTSSKVVGGVQDGETPGINNDVCFCEDPISPDGAFCCDDENFVTNGNFEFGATGFTSNYSQTATTYPGEYDVTTTAAAFGASVTDHSYCTDPVAYINNDLFMVANGKTQQSGSSVIWEQTITGLEQGKRYKFCANFKNMPQCTFDILPVISMEGGSVSSGAQTINTSAGNPCDWQLVSLDFVASGSSETVRILLDETGNGDGNDVAIDDIYVGVMGDPDLAITVQHDGTNNTVTGSLNTITTTDDDLHGSCDEYYWFVAETTSYPAISIDWSSFAYGNNASSMLPPAASVPGSSWNLTTNFPGYPFVDNKLYIVGMYTPECGCYDRGFTYQLTLNSRAKSSAQSGLTLEQEEEIIDAILNGVKVKDKKVDETIQNSSNKASIYPNPVKDSFTITLKEDKISAVEITNLSGKVLSTQKLNGTNSTMSIDISKYSVGIYFVKVLGNSNEVYSMKFIKK